LKNNRKSWGFRQQVQSNLSSTGEYNSITKQYKDDERARTVNFYAPSKNHNFSSKSKPIFQISETGGSVENFNKWSPSNWEKSVSSRENLPQIYEEKHIFTSKEPWN